MKKFGGIRVCTFLCVVVLAALAAGVRAAEEEGTTDIVFALDISGSMNQQRRLETVRKRLCEFIENEIDVGANVTVITFGGSAKLVASRQIRSDADKAALVRKIRGIGVELGGTYMTGGIELALRHLEEFFKKSPTRSRILVLLTDGRNHPPLFPPRDQQATFQKLLDRYEKRPDFVPGQDWFFWYCFIGRPDREAQEFVERLQGEAKPVNEGWHFIKVRFNRVVVKLGTVPVGDWTREFPPKEDRAMGDKLMMTTRTPGDYELQLSDVILDDAGPEEKLTVSPKKIRMRQKQQSVVLKFTGRKIAPGTRHGRIVIRCPGKLLFVKPQQFHVTFKAEAASVTVAPRDGLQFGRIRPGQTLEKTFELIPNPAARLLTAGKKVRVVLPKDLPPGVKLSAEPSEVALGEATSVKLKMQVEAGAVIPAKGYKGAVGFSEIQGVQFSPSALLISTESPGKAEIDVAPRRIEFGTIQPGSEVVREITLSPNDAARSLGPKVTLSTAGALPQGVTLKIEPQSVEMKKQASVRLTLRRDAGAGKVGAIKGAIALKVKGARTVLSLEALPWKAEEAAAVIDVTPGKEIDFGGLEFGQERTQSVWLSPNAAAAKMEPEVRLSADGLADGAKLVFEPDHVKLAQKQEIKITLTAGSKAGKREAKVRLKCADPSVQLDVSELSATYEAHAGGITIDAKGLDYKDVFPGDSSVKISVPVTASAGAMGKTVALRWKFDAPKGMSITPSPSQITVSQARQDVSFVLSLTGAVTGKYTGRVKFSSDVPVRPQELPVAIDVLARGIELIGAPEVWTVQVSRFTGKGEGELPLVVRASPAAAGTTLTFESSGNLPQGTTVRAEPPALKLSGGENQVKLKAEHKGNPSFWGITYRGRLKLATDKVGVVLHPTHIEWAIVVPSLWPYVAFISGVVLVALYTVLPRPIDREAELLLKRKPPDTDVLFMGAPKEEEEALEIGMLRRMGGIWIGSSSIEGSKGPDVGITNVSEIEKKHAKILRKGGKHWIRAYGPIEIQTGAGRSIHVGAGRCERLYYGDEIQVGSVSFAFELLQAGTRPEEISE
ncbi:MAG: VWA domain-containing protein [Planctomycetes bacterium]|nr:VWA domain-containing protein [Planctomycetota bacterium]